MPILDPEIKATVFEMGGSKSIGPNNFQGTFYETFWDITCSDVNELARECLSGGSYPWSLNSTNIILIPKIPNPEVVNQFRPISLYVYSYKVLSKILANRVKSFLPSIISPSQNTFVAGRQIQDNIVIAHEIFHFLKFRKTKMKFELGIKLDMSNAYDRVKWDFLEADAKKRLCPRLGHPCYAMCIYCQFFGS